MTTIYTRGQEPASYSAFLRAKGLNPLPCTHTEKKPGHVIITSRGAVVVEKAA